MEYLSANNKRAYLEFLKEKFRSFNALYFNSELKEPNFAIFNSKHTLGLCIKSNIYNFIAQKYEIMYEIKISKYYKLSNYDICNTLLHEMIHLYIFQKDLRDNSTHGNLFHNIANKINGWGWKITDKANLSDDIKLTKSNKNYNVFIVNFLNDKNNKKFIFVSSNKSVNTFLNHINKSSHIELITHFISNNQIFDKFPSCRTTIKGKYITDNECEYYINMAIKKEQV